MAEAFVTTNGEVDASLLKQELVELLEAKFPGWNPAAGDLLLWIAEGVARISADVFEQMTSLEQAAFKRFGEAIVSVPPVQAAPATVESVWTMVDEAGHTIDAGTQVGIPGPEGKPLGFQTVGETVIPPGSSKATILLEAIEAGESRNELSGEAILETLLSYVLVPAGIKLEGETAGGVDEEDEAAYLNRLVETLRLLSISLILPEDFEVDARSHPGIARCKCVRNYNPEDKSTENPLMQCVFPIDVNGEPVSSLVKEELLASQQAKLISGVIHHVADPEYTEFDVSASIVIEPGFDEATVLAAVKARLVEYLSPANWGKPTSTGDTGNSAGWVNRTAVYRNELISTIDRVPGVDRVVTVEMAKHGGGLSAAAEIALKGVAPLAKAGTITVTA